MKSLPIEWLCWRPWCCAGCDHHHGAVVKERKNLALGRSFKNVTVDPLGFTLFVVFAAYVITGRFPFGFDSLNTLARVCTLARNDVNYNGIYYQWSIL